MSDYLCLHPLQYHELIILQECPGNGSIGGCRNYRMYPWYSRLWKAHWPPTVQDLWRRFNWRVCRALFKHKPRIAVYRHSWDFGMTHYDYVGYRCDCCGYFFGERNETARSPKEPV